MTSVFFVSIRPSFDPLESMAVDALYQAIGRNTGNLLFTNAVWRHVAWDHAEYGFSLDPDHVNGRFDQVIIPAANWLYEKFDVFGHLAASIEKLRVPVTLIGLGAQASIEKAMPVLPEGTVRLLRAVSERSALLGTRGEFTNSVLAHYGIHNYQTIGCPSLFLTKPTPRGHADPKQPLRVAIGGTRYFLQASECARAETDPQRALYRLAFASRAGLVLQSERPEIDLLSKTGASIRDQSLLKIAADYYAAPDAPTWVEYLTGYARYFLDVDEWINHMRSFDFYLGSRLHGAIASLLAGTPACLVAHDSRTTEVAEYAGIPFVDTGAFSRLGLELVEQTLDDSVCEKFMRGLPRLRRNYVRFLEANAICHRIVDD